MLVLLTFVIVDLTVESASLHGYHFKMKKRLEVLREKQEKLAAQIKQIEARSKQRDRKLETRRKILVGSMVTEWMEKDPELKARIEAGLKGWLTRDIDRKAFGLEPLTPKKDDSK